MEPQIRTVETMDDIWQVIDSRANADMPMHLIIRKTLVGFSNKSPLPVKAWNEFSVVEEHQLLPYKLQLSTALQLQEDDNCFLDVLHSLAAWLNNTTTGRSWVSDNKVWKTWEVFTSWDIKPPQEQRRTHTNGHEITHAWDLNNMLSIFNITHYSMACGPAFPGCFAWSIFKTFVYKWRKNN